MARAKWNVDAQMVEVFEGDEHFMLNPNLEVEGRWGQCKPVIESRGYQLPTPRQLQAMHALLKEINELIVAHYGSTLKTVEKYWSNNLRADRDVDIVFLYNGLRQAAQSTSRFLARGVVTLKETN